METTSTRCSSPAASSARAAAVVVLPTPLLPPTKSTPGVRTDRGYSAAFEMIEMRMLHSYALVPVMESLQQQRLQLQGVNWKESLLTPLSTPRGVTFASGKLRRLVMPRSLLLTTSLTVCLNLDDSARCRRSHRGVMTFPTQPSKGLPCLFAEPRTYPSEQL